MTKFKIGDVVKLVRNNSLVQVSDYMKDGRLEVTRIADRLTKSYVREEELEKFE